MKLKRSISAPDATAQVANNGDRILVTGARKWDIQKTLVRILAHGMHQPYYLNSKNEVVIYLFGRPDGWYPKIGEVSYTKEPIEIIEDDY